MRSAGARGLMYAESHSHAFSGGKFRGTAQSGLPLPRHCWRGMGGGRTEGQRLPAQHNQRKMRRGVTDWGSNQTERLRERASTQPQKRKIRCGCPGSGHTPSTLHTPMLSTLTVGSGAYSIKQAGRLQQLWSLCDSQKNHFITINMRC